MQQMRPSPIPLLTAVIWLSSVFYPSTVAQAQVPAESSGPATWDAVRIHIGVYSSPRRYERRLMIRGTWMRYLPPTVHVHFVMGQPDNPPEVQKPDEAPDDLTTLNYLTAENVTWGDIIFLNVPESTKIDKMVALHEYQSRMLRDQYDYYGKSDDDIVLHPYNLYMAAWALPRNEMFWGWCLPGHTGPEYPYMCGAFYLFSKDVVPCIGESSKHNAWVAQREHHLQWDDMNLGIFYHWCSGKTNYTRPGMVCASEERFFQYNFALHERSAPGPPRHLLHNTTVFVHPLKPIKWFTDMFNAFKPNLDVWTACSKAGTPPNRCPAWGQQFGPFRTPS